MRSGISIITRENYRAFLRALCLAWLLAYGPSVSAQVSIVGTSSNSGTSNTYLVSAEETNINITSVGSLSQGSGSGHLVGSFLGNSEKQILRVRKTSARTFVFSTTSSDGTERTRRIELSRDVGDTYYLMTGFNVDNGASDDIAIIDISKHNYRWFIISNPIVGELREVESFILGFSGDRVEWTTSKEHGTEYAALRHSEGSARVRLMLKSANKLRTRKFRFRWTDSIGLLIPSRMNPASRYDPNIALYAPAKKEILVFSRSRRTKVLALPTQRCDGVQSVTGISALGSVIALEVCPGGTYVISERRSSGSDTVAKSGAFSEPLESLRKIDHTRVHGNNNNEIAVPIVPPGSNGAAAVPTDLISRAPLLSLPVPTATATPVVPSVNLDSAPSGISTQRGLVSTITGINATEWRYAFGEDELTCDSNVSWSQWQPTSTSLNLDLGYPKAKVLCLQGRANSESTPGPIREYRWFLAFENDIDLGSIENISIDAPLILAESVSTDPRSRFSDTCINNRGSSSVTVDSLIYFLTICNNPAGPGWSACLASWDGTSANASWIDANPVTAGFQAHWSKCSKASNGTTNVGNLYKYNFASLPDGRIFGTYNSSGGGCFPALSTNGFYPIVATNFTSMTSANTQVANHNWAQPIEAGTWRASYDRYGSWVNSDEDGDLWIYNTSRDANNRAYFWAVEKSASDFTSPIAPPSDYLAADYINGMVRRKDSTYHFIGFHNDRQRWEHVIGRSPIEFDWDHPTDLGLNNLLSTPSKWFSANALVAASCSTVGPYIHSFEVHTNSQGQSNIFIFYRAGDIANQSATTLRGIGAIKIPLGTSRRN